MRKISMLFALTAALFTVSCDPPDDKASLSVKPATVEFEATGNKSVTLAVTAQNTEWKSVSESSAREWLTATDTDEGIVISVTDNGTTEKRTGIVMVEAVGNTGVKPVDVTVTQAAGNFNITVVPGNLEFVGEGAEPQEVTVTVAGGDIKWTAAPEEAIGEWVTVSSKGDKLTVSVKDNPETTDRQGNVLITPDIADSKPTVVKIIQKGKILPPSLEVTPDALSFEAVYTTAKILSVEAVNVAWTVTTSDSEGKPVPWITAVKVETTSCIQVTVTRNTLLEERTGKIVVKSDVESVPDVEITVTQEAGKEYISTLTGPVEISDMEPTGGFRYMISPAQLWDEESPATWWDMELWGGAIGRTTDSWGKVTYTGSGSRLKLKLYTTRMTYNDAEVFIIPDGTYEIKDYPSLVTKKDMVPFTLQMGKETSNMERPSGSWYNGIDDGSYGEGAPFMEGSMTVTYNAEAKEYTFTFDFKDDQGYSITGTCAAKVTDQIVNYHPQIKPDPQNPPGPGDQDPPTPEV